MDGKRTKKRHQLADMMEKIAQKVYLPTDWLLVFMILLLVGNLLILIKMKSRSNFLCGDLFKNRHSVQVFCCRFSSFLSRRLSSGDMTSEVRRQKKLQRILRLSIIFEESIFNSTF